MYGNNKFRAEAYCERHGHAWEAIDTWIDIATDDYVIACEEIYCPRCNARGIFNQRFNWERKLDADVDDDRAEDDS